MTPAQYRRLLDAIVQIVVAATLHLIPLVMSGRGDDQTKKDLIVKVLLPQIRAARSRAVGLATQFIQVQAVAQGVEGNVPVNPDSGYAEQALRAVLDDVWSAGSPQQVAQQAASRVARHTENGARETVKGTSTASEGKVGWARMLTGADNCAFCVMLASRGPVYSSAKAAGRVPASLKFVDSNGWINDYHDNCDCLVVPVFSRSKWAGREQQRSLYKLWNTATDGYSQNDALNALRRHLAQLGRDGQQIVPDLRVAA